MITGKAVASLHGEKDLHELITRFGLRNRTRAVAFAIRVSVL
jgi:hypothetical protein